MGSDKLTNWLRKIWAQYFDSHIHFWEETYSQSNNEYVLKRDHSKYIWRCKICARRIARNFDWMPINPVK